MRGLMTGLLAVISSMTMAQNRKSHSLQVNSQVNKSLLNSDSCRLVDGVTIICIEYASPKYQDPKLKPRPFISLPYKGMMSLRLIARTDSLKK
jgi:hypothetical protein